MTDFCKLCGIKINRGSILGIGKSQFYEFEDGVYCDKCAKIKVERDRKKCYSK